MCGQEYKGENLTTTTISSKPHSETILSSNETVNSTIQEFLNNDNPVKIEEKEVVMEEQKTLKGAHKPCKNHPEKYAVKEGLCYRCYREKNGISPYFKEKQTELNKVDEGKAASVDNKTEKVKKECSTCINIPTDTFCKDCVNFSLWKKAEVPEEKKRVTLKDCCGILAEVPAGDIRATKICEIWQVKDGEATAEIIFKEGNFESCEISGNILLDSGDFASLELDDWLFIGKVAREIERLAGER